MFRLDGVWQNYPVVHLPLLARAARIRDLVVLVVPLDQVAHGVVVCLLFDLLDLLALLLAKLHQRLLWTAMSAKRFDAMGNVMTDLRRH